MDPLDLRPEEVDLLDIAHALSMMCRFTGHCVSRACAPEDRLWGACCTPPPTSHTCPPG